MGLRRDPNLRTDSIPYDDETNSSDSTKQAMVQVPVELLNYRPDLSQDFRNFLSYRLDPSHNMAGCAYPTSITYLEEGCGHAQQSKCYYARDEFLKLRLPSYLVRKNRAFGTKCPKNYIHYEVKTIWIPDNLTF